jgi:glycine cleavage system H protein
MVVIEGCNFPEEGFLYDVENQMWVRFDEDGSITSGLTDIGQHIAGSLLYVKPKKPGSSVKKSKRIAIIESGKYVGPINAPLSGEVIELNQAVVDDAGLVNRDPYGEGWIFRLKPEKLEKERPSLLAGRAAVEAIGQKMSREDWDCFSRHHD